MRDRGLVVYSGPWVPVTPVRIRAVPLFRRERFRERRLREVDSNPTDRAQRRRRDRVWFQFEFNRFNPAAASNVVSGISRPSPRRFPYSCGAPTRIVNDIDAVLFDLDGTLCRHAGDAGVAYRRAFERIGAEPFGEPAALWAALDGPPDPDDRVGYLGAGLARVAAQRDRDDIDPIALAEALVDGIDEIGVEFLPGAAAALDAASARGATGIITNGPEDRQARKVRALGLAERVDLVVYAGDLPRRKPHAAPFREALAALDVPAERALYVGDSLAYDVAGAHNAGLRVAWLRSDAEDGGDDAPGDDDSGDYHPDHVLDGISDLAELLEGS